MPDDITSSIETFADDTKALKNVQIEDDNADIAEGFGLAV